MKKITLALLLYCLFSFQVYPQGSKQKKIDRYCNKIDSIIFYDSDSHTAYMIHSMNFETNKRAIGKQNTSVRFFYPMPIDSVVETEKGTDFIYIYKLPVRVDVEYNIAASQNVTLNYYFNEKGKLLLLRYRSTGEYGCSDVKKYFDKNKLIVTTELMIPDCRTSDLMASLQNSMNEVKIRNNAKAYLKMFDEMVETEQLDK